MSAAPPERSGLDLSPRGWAVPWLAWTATRALMVLGVAGTLFYRWGFSIPADLHLYFLWAYVFQHGVMPYRDIQVVYPPGILAVLVLPAKTLSVYVTGFLAAALAADAVVFARLRRLPQRWGSWVWLVGAALAGPVLWARLDIFVALAIVMGLIDAHQGHPVRAAAWFGLGASLKLWPVLLVVPLLAAGRGRTRWVTLGAALAPGVLLTAPVAAWGSLPQLASAVQAQAGRALEVEAVLAAPLAVARPLGLWHGRPEPGLSFQFAGPAAHNLAVAASVLMAVGVLLWLARVWMRPRASLALTTLVLAAILLTTGRVLSAQYAVWVMAPAAVLGGYEGSGGRGPRRTLWIWLAVALLTTQALFPFAYASLLYGGWAGALVAAGHAVAIVGLLVSAVKAWLAMPDEHQGNWEEVSDLSHALHPDGPFADSPPCMSARRDPAPLSESVGRP